MKHENSKNQEIVIYRSKEGPKIDVCLTKDTVRLSLNQISALFQTDKSGISRHIKSIFDSEELDPKSTVAKIATVQTEGNRQIKRNIEHYNLDMIISVGYRVNSKKATQFRVWATKTLKDFLIKGYTINETRLLSTKDKFQELQNAISDPKDKEVIVKIITNFLQ